MNTITSAPTRAEIWLVRLLHLAAGVLLLATFAVFLPPSWMGAGHRALGMGELPDRPLVGYLTRSIAALYAFHGAVILLSATDVRRYAALIRLMAVGDMIFGVTLLGIDLYVGMPWFWTAAEGPSLVAFAVVILLLQRRVVDK